jgi:hypothetical protein
MPAGRLVFLDESGLRLGTPPRYGWSKRGQDCEGTAVHGCWTTMTMMGAGSMPLRIRLPTACWQGPNVRGAI